MDKRFGDVFKNMNRNKNLYSFGYVNINTGEFESGYVNKQKEMKYKNPLPWYKRIFCFKSFINIWEPSDYVCTFTVTENYLSNPLFGKSTILRNSHETALYRERNVFSLKYRYFYIDDGQRVYVNSDAFEKDCKIVLV